MKALQAACATPWAIRPEALEQILAIAGRTHIADLTAAAEKLKARNVEIDSGIALSGLATDPGTRLAGTAATRMRGSVAVVPVQGPIFRYANLFSEMSGATSLEMLARDFNVALREPDVSAILLHIDSPGGEVNGTAEFADMVRKGRAKKPVVAYVSHEGASAAYWIASAADRIVCAPTSIIGSIGVVAAVPKPEGEDGENIEFVSSQSPNKRPDPLSPPGRAQIQQLVDDTAHEFITAVASNRGVTTEDVLANYGQGGVFVGQRSVDAGLADAVGNFEDTLKSLAEPRKLRVVSNDEGSPAREAAMSEHDLRASAESEHVDLTAGAIPPHQSGGIAPDSSAWDASAEVAKADGAAQLRRMHAWVDSSGDPDAKSSYKLPHHRADGTLVPRGVSAAAQRLDQTDIPEGDKSGVRRHLDAHYSQMNKTAPWNNDGSGDSKSWHEHDHPHAETNPPFSGTAEPAAASTTTNARKGMSWKDRLLAAINSVPEDEDDVDGTAASVRVEPAASTDRAQLEATYRREIQARDQEIASQREANRRLQAERIRERGETFAAKVIEVDKKAFPAERDHLVALYVQAATDDLALPVSAGMTRVDQLAAAYSARSKHLLTEETIPEALHNLAALANVVDTPRPGASDKPMDDKRRADLLQFTTAGREVLAAERAQQRNGR